MSDVRRIRRRWQRGIRAAVASALVLLPLAAAQAVSAPAQAATVITFDDLAAGSQLTTQYAADGVTFGVAAPGQGVSAAMDVFSDSSAFSPPNDAGVGGCGEACQANMWAEFSSPQQQVSMFLDNEGVNGTVSSTVNAYNGSGNLVASAPFTAQPNVWQQVSVSDPAGSIIYIEVVNWENGCCPAFRMDNLSFTGSNQPDFALVPGFSPTYGAGVPAGGTTNISFTLRRFGGSAGNITFTHNTLPAGVTLTMSPNPDGNGDNTPVQGTITAAPGATPSSFPVTITASPDSTSGTTAHSVTFPLTVQGTYQLRVQGIEITQGVQNTALPARDPADLSAPVSYGGVQLVDGKTTAVRVFADAPGAPAGGILGVTAQLTGFTSSGQQLPGTLLPGSSTPNEAGTGGLVDTGSATVPNSERNSATGSFDFLLPASWDGQVATLKVTLIPASLPVFGPPPAELPCTTAACGTLASMTLDNISYTNTGDLRLGYVQLTNGIGFPLTESAFGWTRLIPDGDQSSYLAPAGTLDIGWVLAGCPSTLFGGTQNLCPTRGSKNIYALSELRDDVANAQTALGNSLVQGFLGVTNQDLGVEDGSSILSGRPDAVVDVNRPVTDIDHEIGHMLGLVHASFDCGGGANGQPAEAWPPDQHGYINSTGLDITGIPPFPVVAGPGGPQRPAAQCTGPPPVNPPACGGVNPAQFFDFMSYCTWNDPNPDGTLGSTDAWVSARNWDQMAGELAAANSSGSALGLRHATVAAKPPGAASAAMMRVYGYANPQHQPHITVIDPTSSSAPITGSASGFAVAAVSGAGTTTATASLYGQTVHVDGVSGMQLLEGALPLSAGTTAAKLVITQGGKVLFTLPRPVTRPTVTITSAPNPACSVKAVTVKWDASDPAKAHLTAAVDFSADGGTTWTEVYDGPAANTGTAGSGAATIPSALLRATSDAEIRVRISDGYNQVSAHTGQFCVAPFPPTVTITAPAADQLTPGGTAALYGTAYDDNGQPITGKSLAWRAYGPGLSSSGVSLGSGSPLITTLPAATTQVTLTATSAGRSATATEQAAPSVIPLTPQNGWTGGPFGTAQPAATLIAGIVHLQGAVATTGTNPVAFTLPPALRPATNVYVPVDQCGATKGRLFIQPDGTVTVQAEKLFANAQCFTSLDGASYVLQATTPLTPLNGWAGAPFGTSQPAATLVSGVVHLQGALTANGSTSPWVFTLPPALRPATNVYVPVDLCNAANGRLLIQPDGTVTVQAENSFSDAQCFTSLDGASFALTASIPLTTVNGWTGAPFGTSQPAAALVSGVVQLQGAISTTGTNPAAFTLPAGLRPTANVYVPVDLCNAANGRLNIQPDGTVTVEAENSFSDAQCFTSLDGVSFLP